MCFQDLNILPGDCSKAKVQVQQKDFNLDSGLALLWPAGTVET